MRPFFTVTSVLLYYMAFVFMGKGIRELQEGNIIGITVVRGLPNVPSMGIFPSLETLAGQACADCVVRVRDGQDVRAAN